MASAYRIQVASAEDGVVHSWAPGMQTERDFVNEIVNRVAAKGVGIGRSQAHVLQDVRDAINELLYELKLDVRPRA